MKNKKALAAGLCGANCPGCIQKTHICWFEREKPVCHSFVSALERCAFLPALPGRCCRWEPPAKPGAWGSPRRAYYRQRSSRGPRTVRPAALPTRGRPLKGRFTYALISLLPVNWSINSFRLIWSAIWSSSSWCLMYSAICFLFHPTVST